MAKSAALSAAAAAGPTLRLALSRAGAKLHCTGLTGPFRWTILQMGERERRARFA